MCVVTPLSPIDRWDDGNGETFEVVVEGVPLGWVITFGG
jgi:hypothetical protein